MTQQFKTINSSSPEKQAQIDAIYKEYAQKMSDINRNDMLANGRIALGSLLSGASFHPILNIPYVGTGVGGAMFDLGQGIVEGDKIGDLAKRTGRGFAIGETVGAVPYVGKGVNKLNHSKVGLLSKLNPGAGSTSIYEYLSNPKSNKNFEKELQKVINPPTEIDPNTIKAYIGAISDEVYNLGAKNGYDLTNFNHTLDRSAYNHFLKHIGDNEVAEELIPLTTDDLKNIPNIIYSPDNLEFIEATNKKLPRIKYTKKTKNGNQVYIEQLQNKTKRLNTKTYWKEK